MICRRIEKLIPLYIEGDLDTSVTGDVMLHLASCSRCSRIATEYIESQSWLRSYVSSDFSDAELDDLKGQVLKEIELVKTRPAFLRLLGERWTIRQFAVATVALLILCGTLVFYFYYNKAGAPSDSAKQSNVESPDKNSPPEIAPQAGDTEPAPGANLTAPRRNAQNNLHKRARHKMRVRHAVEQVLATRMEIVPAVEPTETQPVSNADMREMLRIEIQTSDPKIRIIWFAPKETGSHQPKTMPETDQETLW